MTAIFGFLASGLDHGVALAALAAVAWGLASVVLSPCHLATVPLSIAFLRADPAHQRPTWLLSLVFAAAVLVSLGIMGGLTAAAGRIVGDFWGMGPWIAVLLLVAAGLYLLEVFEFPSGVTLDQNKVPRGLTGAVVVGGTVGLTLGPCTFAFMAPVIATAMAGSMLGAAAVVTAFALGHTTAIALAGLLGLRVGVWLRGGARATLWIKRVTGASLVVVAVYLVATMP